MKPRSEMLSDGPLSDLNCVELYELAHSLKPWMICPVPKCPNVWGKNDGDRCLRHTFGSLVLDELQRRYGAAISPPPEFVLTREG